MSLDALEAVLRAQASTELTIGAWAMERTESVVIVTAVTQDDDATMEGGFALAAGLLEGLLAVGYAQDQEMDVAAVRHISGDLSTPPRWRGRLKVSLVPAP